MATIVPFKESTGEKIHWHIYVLNICVLVTHIGHIDHAGLAGGAGVVARVQQLLEAGPVQQVPAVRDVAGDARRVDVLQAHGTVRPRYILHALEYKLKLTIFLLDLKYLKIDEGN